MRPFPGLVNFAHAVAYHFCLNIPAAFSQPGNSLIVKPCILTADPGFLFRERDDPDEPNKATCERRNAYVAHVGDADMSRTVTATFVMNIDPGARVHAT